MSEPRPHHLGLEVTFTDSTDTGNTDTGNTDTGNTDTGNTDTGGTAEFVLSGDLDVTVVPQLSEQLDWVLARQPGRLIFDMAAVTFLDCGAAWVLVQAAGRLADGTRPVIRSPGLPIRKLLRAARFDAAFQFEQPDG